STESTEIIRSGAERAHRFFHRLGAHIEALWSQSMFDERELPAIAERALLNDPPSVSISKEDIIAFVLAANDRGAPIYPDSKEAEPPIAVYVGRRFYIEVLFWIDATTDIHQHGFDGAFCVLEGSSVHSTYRFHESHRLSVRMLLGDLVHQNSEV